MDRESYTGEISQDTDLYFYYTPERYTLTIRYVFRNGREAAETYEEELVTGAEYDIPNPEVEGYRTARESVKGVMEGRDKTITVLYVPEDELTLLSIDDYETPLGVNQNNLQIGICIE